MATPATETSFWPQFAYLIETYTTFLSDIAYLPLANSNTCALTSSGFARPFKLFITVSVK